MIITESETSVEQAMTNIGEQVKSHRYAYFMLDGKKVFASVNKGVKPEMEKRKEQLSISICRDKDGKQFWLIHLSKKVTVPLLEPVDVDELNKELDALLKT